MRVQRKGSLYANAVGHLAHGEGLTHGSVMTPNACTFKDLNTLFLALDHFDVDAATLARAAALVAAAGATRRGR
mgnify:CR=1 FL=1